MSEFLIRVINVFLVVGIIIGFNNVVANRQNKEDALYSQAIEKAKEVEEWNKAVLASEGKTTESMAGDEEKKGYKEGEYYGTAEGFGGPIEVKVIVKDGLIQKISIESAENEDEAYLTMATDIIEIIIENQSTEIDTISGATFSSTGIRNATENALEGAVQ